MSNKERPQIVYVNDLSKSSTQGRFGEVVDYLAKKREAELSNSGGYVGPDIIRAKIAQQINQAINERDNVVLPEDGNI